jgi:peptidoglycan hydrolase-like protein with peptidoglycan-binding domain
MFKKFDEFNETLNEGFWDWLTGKSEKGEKKEKSTSAKEGPIDSQVEAYYKTLQDFADSNKSIEVQAAGSMEYSKLVEDIQLALEFLGYKLTKYGVDGYFGPETAEAIVKFNEDTLKKIPDSQHD